MRIAHFVQRYPPALGGAEAYFARLSRFLAAAGDHVTVFTTNAIDLECFFSTRGKRARCGERIEDGVAVRRFRLLHLPLHAWVVKALSYVPHNGWKALAMPWNPLAWDMWTSAGRDQGPFDLVHAAAFPYGWPLACGLRLARRLRVPFVLTPFLHLGDNDDPADPMRQAYLSPPLLALARAADRLFVQTEGEFQALEDNGIPRDRIVLQGMGVDLASCTGGNRARFRERLGCKPDDVVIGHLANNSFEKGTIDLVRAAERAWSMGGRFHLLLAGPEMPRFRRFWQHHVTRGSIYRLGILSEEQKRDFFSSIDVFALPSRSDSFGIVLLEAWANGAPNMVYRAGGLPWVVHHEGDGLVVKCGDLNELAAGLARLSQDPELRRKLGEAGRARLGEFRWDDKLTLVRNVYMELVGKRGVTSLPLR